MQIKKQVDTDFTLAGAVVVAWTLMAVKLGWVAARLGAPKLARRDNTFQGPEGVPRHCEVSRAGRSGQPRGIAAGSRVDGGGPSAGFMSGFASVSSVNAENENKLPKGVPKTTSVRDPLACRVTIYRPVVLSWRTHTETKGELT